MLAPLDLPPGQLVQGTRYMARGRWFAGNLIRWIDKALRPVYGWTAVQTIALPKHSDTDTQMIAKDLFTGTAELNDHTPDHGITAWSYPGSDPDWLVGNALGGVQGAYRDVNGTHPYRVAISTNDITETAAGIEAWATIHRVA